jgi:type VI protein secretion system component VasK
VTIKTLLFLLFLYICLVWVGAAYLHPGTEFREFGLRWTLVGLVAAFVFIVGSHLFNWWRRWRAKPKPEKPAAKPSPIVHEDDIALANAIAEANTNLAKGPEHRYRRYPIYELPWRLLVGPEGSGKTSILLNSGIEPQLLSGQAAESGGTTSTRICNVWLAKSTIFCEIPGRFFDGDLARWTQLLRVLRGTKPLPLWQRLLGKREPTVDLRGVIGCCDLREFTSASADPQRFERYCRNWHDRLSAISDVFRYPRSLQSPTALPSSRSSFISFQNRKPNRSWDVRSPRARPYRLHRAKSLQRQSRSVSPKRSAHSTNRWPNGG